jgi:hypothetical protein
LQRKASHYEGASLVLGRFLKRTLFGQQQLSRHRDIWHTQPIGFAAQQPGLLQVSEDFDIGVQPTPVKLFDVALDASPCHRTLQLLEAPPVNC